jgi:hypothetical protein
MAARRGGAGMIDDKEKQTVGLIAVVSLVPLLIVNGLVVCLLWRWFIADTFQIATLSLLQSIGVALFVSYFRGSYKPIYIKKQWVAEDYARLIVHGLIVEPIIFLGIGCLVHLLI